MGDYVAVLFKKQIIDSDKEIFIPTGIIKLKDINKLIGVDGIQYHSIYEQNEENYIFFPIAEDALKQLYESDYINEYFNDVKNYSIIKDANNFELIYTKNGKSEIVQIEDFSDFFLSHINSDESNDINIKELYDLLKSNVFMQDEAIKKIIVALSLHYMDTDEKEKVNIIIDGDKGTGKTAIINCIKDIMPCSVIVEDLGDENFSFDYLFLSMYNNKQISSCPILVLDNADKLLLNSDLDVADKSINIIKNLMLGVDFKLQTSSGAVSYPTKDFVVIVSGDFKKRLRCGIDNYVEGVPNKISRLTNYNIKMNPMTKEMVYAKLLNEENGTFAHYVKYLTEAGVEVNYTHKLINKIVDKVMKSNMHELDIIVEKCFEDILFDLYTSEERFTKLSIDHNVLKDSKKYILK